MGFELEIGKMYYFSEVTELLDKDNNSFLGLLISSYKGLRNELYGYSDENNVIKWLEPFTVLEKKRAEFKRSNGDYIICHYYHLIQFNGDEGVTMGWLPLYDAYNWELENYDDSSCSVTYCVFAAAGA